MPNHNHEEDCEGQDQQVDIQSLLQKLKEMAPEEVPNQVFLIGDISEQSWGFFSIQLAQLEGHGVKDVNIKLTSTGGSMGVGFAMHDLIKNSSADITVEVYAYACSAAILPLMAASNRGMSKNSRLFLHEAFMSIDHSMDMTNKSLIDHRKELEILFNGYCKIIANRSGLPIRKVKELCEKETYLSAKEAMKLNLIDFII